MKLKSWFFVQVGAAELSGDELQLGGYSLDPLAAGLPNQASEQPPFLDIHGPAQGHGVWTAPKLLPEQAQRPADRRMNNLRTSLLAPTHSLYMMSLMCISLCPFTVEDYIILAGQPEADVIHLLAGTVRCNF